MSIEFNAQGFPGWFQDDPNKPTILRANVATLRSKSGGIAPIVAEINYADGSIQYYDIRGGIGFNGPRIPLFTQNASGTRTVQNQGNLNELRPEDIARIESSVKNVAFRANQSLATTPQKEALRNSSYYQSLGNSPPPTPQGDQQGGNPQTQSQGGGTTTPTGNGTPQPVVLPEPSQIQPIDIGSNELVLGTPLKISSGSGIRYPLRMNDEQDKIKFLAVEISRSADSIDGQPIYTPVDGPIFLSIQAPITDQNSVDWGPDSVNAIEAFLYNKSLEIMKSDDPNKTVAGTFKDIINGFTGNTDRIRKFLAGQAAGLNNVLSRTDSAILNPNLELLFQGPQLRPFTFQFKMTAREPNEAVAIKRIIKYFKYHMSVRREQGLFLRAPHVFTIQYLKGMEPKHPGINLISPEDNKKACALTNCSVDYTPLGSYMTYKDNDDKTKQNDPANGTMVAYTLSMQFQEITPIYDTDYTDAHPIGF